VNLFTGKIADIGGGQEDKGQFDASFFVDASGGIFLTSKEIINEVGLFDERFNPYGWEDVDYSIRVRKKGYKIFFNPKAIVYHKGGKKSRPKIITDYERAKAKNYLYLLKKHSNVFQLFTLSIILPFRILGMIIQGLSHGNFKLLLNQFKGFFGYLKNE
jgi:GT2 family glycosyltransferase